MYNALMHARPFDKVKDRQQFNEWSTRHGQPELTDDILHYLPDEGGFIVDCYGCGFVYLTTTRMAYIDQMLINPKAPFRERREAGRMLIDAIMQFARDRNVSMYSWVTANKAIDHYAKYAGAFQVTTDPHQHWYWINTAFKP